MIEKPKNVEEYCRTLLDEKLGVRIGPREERYYSIVVTAMRNQFVEGPFWSLFERRFRDIEDEYYMQHGYNLFMANEPPKVVTKPFRSTLEKSFCRNVLLNTRWPEQPDSGWITPQNWYGLIGDLVRCCVVVKYLDGVAFLLQKFRTFCNEVEFTMGAEYVAREDGYYCLHASVRQRFEIPKRDFDTEFIDSMVEIQVTTQTQEVIRSLLHKYYEKRRMAESPIPAEEKPWQWDYESDEFSANYLGHILHYLEGMIMFVREKGGS